MSNDDSSNIPVARQLSDWEAYCYQVKESSGKLWQEVCIMTGGLQGLKQGIDALGSLAATILSAWLVIAGIVCLLMGSPIYALALFVLGALIGRCLPGKS
jgi:hypothetical protein